MTWKLRTQVWVPSTLCENVKPSTMHLQSQHLGGRDKWTVTPDQSVLLSEFKIMKNSFSETKGGQHVRNRHKEVCHYTFLIPCLYLQNNSPHKYSKVARKQWKSQQQRHFGKLLYLFDISCSIEDMIFYPTSRCSQRRSHCSGLQIKVWKSILHLTAWVFVLVWTFLHFAKAFRI